MRSLAVHTAVAQVRPAKVIVDTDVGDDVDDAFAIDLALASPEMKILGLSSAWGDTELRARMLDRMACETGRGEIAVQAGIPTKSTTAFSQASWAKAGRQRAHGDAVTFLLDQIKAQPGEITLLALGPLTNIGAAIDRDPKTFRKLKRVVLMGGSIYRGYGAPGAPPEPEYNIARDPGAAQKLFRSGVPIFMLPLDSTQLKFDDAEAVRACLDQHTDDRCSSGAHRGMAPRYSRQGPDSFRCRGRSLRDRGPDLPYGFAAY